jgi:hypothetical protein
MIKNTSGWGAYSQSWNSHSSPLRPNTADLANYKSSFPEKPETAAVAQSLVFGVTPELYTLLTESGYCVTGIDSSRQMIETVWPGKPENVFCEDWLSVDTLGRRFMLYACDGGLHLLDFREQESLARKLGAVTSKCDTLHFRLFLPPAAEKTSSSDILGSLENGVIKDLNYLKINLWHADDLNNEGRVFLKDIWKVLLKRSGNDVPAYLSSLGFSHQEIETVRVYENNEASYCFSTLHAIAELFSVSAGLEPVSVYFPNYNQGDQFPVVAFQKK